MGELRCHLEVEPRPDLVGGEPGMRHLAHDETRCGPGSQVGSRTQGCRGATYVSSHDEKHDIAPGNEQIKQIGTRPRQVEHHKVIRPHC